MGISIVPTGELEGRQDHKPHDAILAFIVPTGELEGRQDAKRRIVYY